MKSVIKMNFSYDRKRNPLFHPMHNNFANYCTDTMSKTELHCDFGDEIFLNNLHLIPDPLKKNLADTLITAEKPQKVKQMLEDTTQMSAENVKEMTGSTLSGIYNFFTGVFNSLSGAMFRPKSPVYHDCFGSDSDWQVSNTEGDKIGPVPSPVETGDASDMSSNWRSTAKTCESKLDQIRYVLSAPKQSNSVWVRKRPKKVFVEPGSVEENFEDAFSPEDFVSMPNQTFIECYAPYTCQKEDLYQTGALKTKVEPPWRENTDIVNVIEKDVQENSVLKERDSLECGKETLNLEKDSMQSEKYTLNPEKDSLRLDKDTSNMKKDSVESKKDSLTLLNSNFKLETENMQMEKTNLNLEKQNVDKNEVNTVPNLDKKVDDQIRKSIPNSENQNTSEKLTSNLENQHSNSEQSNPNSLDNSVDEVDYISTDKQKLITSCEDKLSKLKALLSKSKKPRPAYIPEESTSKPNIPNSADKHYKNPHRTTDKRKKSKLKKTINDDMLFANEIDSEILDESPLNSYSQTCLGDYFDEVTGRFRSKTDADDSFQIVFNDRPRVRIPSECDSEDSFIIFEESPDSCYTSNDVFGESDSDSDSEVSDSGCSTLTCKLSPSLSRTVSNLTDDSLYVESGDEIDSSNVETVLKCDEVNKSLLIDDEKKKTRRGQPVKKVHFSSDPPKVHLMRVWAFAARQARAGHWERYAVDRERFKRRINDVDVAVSWVLKPQHRSRVMFQRFMPWWNALRRKELAEKKEREEEERKKQEEERKKQEELVKEQELLYQEELERKELVEKQVEGERIKQDELIRQQEEERREIAEKKHEKHTQQQERLQRSEQRFLKKKELVKKQEELIKKELLNQQELLQQNELNHHRFESDNKCIEEAKNKNIPNHLQNSNRTLDSCNKKSCSSNDCADFEKTLPKEGYNNQMPSLN